MNRLHESDIRDMNKAAMAAVVLGEYEVYDFALPQQWLDQQAAFWAEAFPGKSENDFYHYILSRCVWRYTHPSDAFGSPCFLTEEAHESFKVVMSKHY